MSRSRRKTPICGFTSASSEKYDKRIANRNYRRENKEELNKKLDDYEPLMMEEISGGNIWDWAKDGKQYFGKRWEWMKYMTEEDWQGYQRNLMRK